MKIENLADLQVLPVRQLHVLFDHPRGQVIEQRLGDERVQAGDDQFRLGAGGQADGVGERGYRGRSRWARPWLRPSHTAR